MDREMAPYGTRGHTIRCLLAALVVGVSLSACTSSSGGRDPAGQRPSASAVQHPMLEGIPLPVGFRIVEQHSYGRKSGQLRYASCEFEGKLDPLAVNRFYKEYMPSAGFTLRQERYNRGQHIMEFDSAAEESTVRIEGRRFKTALIVDINPKPKGSAQRDPKPPLRRP